MTNAGSISFWEWIGQNVVRRINNVCLTICAPFTNPEAGFQMVIALQINHSFRCIKADLTAFFSLNHFIGIKASSLFNRSFPQPRAFVTRLSHVTDWGARTPLSLELLHKIFVLRRIEGLKVFHCRVESDQILAANAVRFILGY